MNKEIIEEKKKKPTWVSVLKENALKFGDKYYFTNKPCKNGHNGGRYAISGACSQCTKAENDKLYMERYHKIKHTEGYKKRQAKFKKRYKENNPEKIKAHNVFNGYVKRGKIKKQPCEVCGSSERVHGHHDNYSKPLEVKWLCPRHHIDRHKELDSLNGKGNWI